MNLVPSLDAEQPGPDLHKTDLAAEEASFIEQAKSHLGLVEKPPEEKAAEAKQSESEARYLKEIARLQKQVREKDGEVKTRETWKDKVTAYDELRDLYGKDKVAALGKLAGRDGFDELAELMAPYFEAKAAKEGGGEGAAAAPGLEALKPILDKLDAVTKELADIKASKTAETTQKTEAQAKAEEAGALAHAAAFAKKVGKFEICARPENVEEAAKLATDGAAVILQSRVAKARGISYDQVTAEMTAAEVAKLTPEQADQLLAESYEKVEGEYAALGQRYSKVTEAPRSYNFGPKPTPAPAAPVITLPEKPTEDEFRRYALAKLGL